MQTKGSGTANMKSSSKKGGKLESCTTKRQDADIQKQYIADNAARPGVVPSPMVIGNNNNKNKSFFSETIINDNQSFLSEQFRVNDMMENVK